MKAKTLLSGTIHESIKRTTNHKKSKDLPDWTDGADYIGPAVQRPAGRVQKQHKHKHIDK